MDKMEFKPGDVVVLRSGGAPMTVVEQQGSWVVCIWHDSMAHPQRQVIEVTALEIVPAEAIPDWWSGPKK